MRTTTSTTSLISTTLLPDIYGIPMTSTTVYDNYGTYQNFQSLLMCAKRILSKPCIIKQDEVVDISDNQINFSLIHERVINPALTLSNETLSSVVHVWQFHSQKKCPLYPRNLHPFVYVHLQLVYASSSLHHCLLGHHFLLQIPLVFQQD
jgi:hypothetical protein